MPRVSRVWGGALATAVLLLLAACGPEEPLTPNNPSTTVPDTSALEDDDSQLAPARGQDSGADSLTDGVPSSTNTYKGYPVGLTEDGRAYIGDLNAPVRIEEFSDYQCPYCGRFVTQTFEELKANYVANGEAVVIFYDFPLDFHPQGIPAANAARCAGEQSPVFYWQMHDKLYEEAQAWGVSDPNPVFVGLAEELEMDVDAFESCLTSEKYLPAIEADIQLGIERGVTGTPSFFINGEMLVGALPYETFSQAVELVKSGSSLAAQPQQPEVEIPPFSMPEPAELNDQFAAELGSPEAPITIVEFSDYECPFCFRHTQQTMPQIMAELIDSGRVRYIFKDFPLDQIHPDARLAAEAARCAGEEDKYWEMHDLLFVNQAEWGQGKPNPAEIIAQYAEELTLDMQAFTACIESGRYADAVQANVEEGLSLGVNGTPAFFIDGYFFSGAQPYELFDLVVTNIEAGTLEELYREAYEAQVEAYRQQQAQAQQPTPVPQPVDVDAGNAFAIGSPDAPVEIIEYTDFQCPYCGRHFAQTYPQIFEEYIETGQVRYVFKDYPLNFHLQAPKAAEAARCANDQEAFLDMHNLLFARQGEWSGQDGASALFVGYAEELGLNVTLFSDCLTSGKYTAAVQADLEEGAALGITGTPTFFINGYPLVGAVPYQTFAEVIEQQLGE